MTAFGTVETNPKDVTGTLVLGLIACLFFLAWLVWMLTFSWRQKKAFLVGRFRYSSYPRDTSPLAFWAVMAFYSLLALLSLALIGLAIVMLARGGKSIA
jgi:hypothetical protein